MVRPRLEAARKIASEEAGRRLDQVLKSIDEPTPQRLRQIRACEVLEGIAAPDAVRILRAWAAGPPGARLMTYWPATAITSPYSNERRLARPLALVRVG